MSDPFSQANINSNQIIEDFIAKSKEIGKIELPHLIAQEILSWTEGNSLLTQRLCQLILDRQDQVLEGQETKYVKRIVQSLVKYWENEKERGYHQHLQAIQNNVLQHEQVTTVLLRLHEILLKKEVVATDSLEDKILTTSGLVIRQENKLKIVNRIYAEIFNSEWIKQQLDQIGHKLIVSQASASKFSDVEQKPRSIKHLGILILTILGSLGGIFGLYLVWINFSAAKQCRLMPSDLDLAAKVLTACDRVLKKKPNDTEALINRGKVSFVLWDSNRNQERFDKAIADFTQAKEIEPDNPRALFYLSYLEEFQDLVIRKQPQCLPASDRYQEVIQIYQPFDSITEQDIPILLELGHFLVNREQNYQAAMAIFDSIIKFDENIYQAWSGKATAQFLGKDYFNAQESFERALELNPDSYKIKYNLGSLWARLDNYEKASELYYQVLKAEPNFTFALRDLGLSLYLQNRYQEAALAFTQIIYRPNSKSFQVSAKDRELISDFYHRVEDCLEEAVEGLEVSCSQEDRVPMKIRLYHNGIFHNVIVHGQSSDPFFEVEHHTFFQCFNQGSEGGSDHHLSKVEELN
ncbi:tetratricopeptide repeat protein [Pleurocapsa sp. PCC 7319]|uniref:tetratricopeptide repeat protein n=1 Tax=Pleurocapsa sp. PCC 7319 TaxID=118161 RepID=UPI00034638F3|nr:tetratricopeptide repeat protein [Pleurocapsa sp. PCC 7319]